LWHYECWGWHPLPLHPPSGCCHCHYPATCCGGSTDLEMVGVGVGPNLSRVANNFLFLFVFMAYELATHSTTYTDSKSFLCHSFYHFLYRFKIIFEVWGLWLETNKTPKPLKTYVNLCIWDYALCKWIHMCMIVTHNHCTPKNKDQNVRSS
jgi:hypothetical protein